MIPGVSREWNILKHYYQALAWLSEAPILALCAGVQSGKTTFGVFWTLRELGRRPKGDFLIVCPTYKVMQQSTLPKWEQIVPRDFGTFHRADSVFTTVNGQNIFWRTAENPWSLEGITAQAIWADEASLMSSDTWMIMQGRVGVTEGPILLTFTPRATNWVYHDIYKPWKAGLPEYDFISFASIQSPWFSRKQFFRAKRDMSEAKFAMRYLAQFRKMEGLVYPDFLDNYIIEPFEIPEAWPRYGGIDWGFNNPMVALHSAMSPQGILYFYKEVRVERKLLREFVPLIDPRIPWYADPSGLREIQECRDLGVENIYSGNNDIELRIESATKFIRNGRIKVLRGTCPGMVDEFETYHYPQKGGEKPVKESDHSMNAFEQIAVALESPQGTPRITVC